jgi:DNA-binding NtrC family response regulator
MHRDDPSGAHVVFVDDDLYVLDSMRRVFMHMNTPWHLEFFANPREALEYVKHQPCDAIVSDISMPEMTGFGLLAEVRAGHPAAFCVLLSGDFCEADRLECEQRGYVFLEKPCSLNDVRALIEAGLEKVRQKAGD